MRIIIINVIVSLCSLAADNHVPPVRARAVPVVRAAGGHVDLLMASGAASQAEHIPHLSAGGCVHTDGGRTRRRSTVEPKAPWQQISLCVFVSSVESYANMLSVGSWNEGVNGEKRCFF